MRFLDSNHTASSILQHCKSNLPTAPAASTTSSLLLYNKCRSIANHTSNTTPGTQKSCTESASEPDGTTPHAATGRTTTPYDSPPAQAHGDGTACYDRTRKRSISLAETFGGPRLSRRDALDSPTSNFPGFIPLPCGWDSGRMR